MADPQGFEPRPDEFGIRNASQLHQGPKKISTIQIQPPVGHNLDIKVI